MFNSQLAMPLEELLKWISEVFKTTLARHRVASL